MKSINYKGSGVNIEMANNVKRQFEDVVSSHALTHCKPINKVGAFASLIEIDLSKYKHPIFVLKSEEPGSKQLLSITNRRIEWIARDLINHLVNDIVVTGAVPCAILDTIICGKLEKDVVLKLVTEFSEACIENDCVLVGGETSEQPGVLQSGQYVLQASALGIVDKDNIIDGSNMICGDSLIALASNGLHTNGYSLVRKLMEEKPSIREEIIRGDSFIDCILKPHVSYAQVVKAILANNDNGVRGMAHITGGGIHDNLLRILHGDNLQANVDLSAIKIPPIFGLLRQYADITDNEMLATFNVGVGLIIVADREKVDSIIALSKKYDIDAYTIGHISESTDYKKVTFTDKFMWPNIQSCRKDNAK